MPITVTLANKQRHIQIDVDYWNKHMEALALSVLANLKKQASKHLSLKKVKEIEAKALLSVVFVSNKEIKKINKEWRGKDSATDVISFPLYSDQSPSIANMPFELGEIFISLEKASEQATNLGHSLEREIAFLFVHGFLHVLGFDHQTKPQERDMFGRQQVVLKAAGFLK
jgi:probable rRNA maturation factor